MSNAEQELHDKLQAMLDNNLEEYTNLVNSILHTLDGKNLSDAILILGAAFGRTIHRQLLDLPESEHEKVYQLFIGAVNTFVKE